MKKIELLYGVEEPTWMIMPYHYALDEKIRLAKKLLNELHKVAWLDRDETRVSAVVKAIEFNKMLKDE